MKNLLLILLAFSFCSLIHAQDSTKIAADSVAAGVRILEKIELNSALAAQPLAWNDKIVTVEKSGSVSCYDTTSHVIWKNNLNVEITSRPVIADDVLVVGDTGGDIFTLDMKTGNQIQSIGLDKPISSDLISFDYKGDIELAMPKSSDSKSVIVAATQDGKIHCYDLETLQEYWTNKDTKDTVSGAPFYLDNKILFNSADGFLYCIDAGNGLLIWRWKESAESSFYHSNIVSDGKTIFVVSDNNDIFAIDFLLGKLAWQSKNIKVLPGLSLSRDKKILYTETQDKRILLFSAAQGKVSKAVKLDETFDEKTIPILERENKLFFVRGNGIFIINDKYQEEHILSFGNSAINFIAQIDEAKFLTSNINGTLIIFSLR